MNARRMTTKSLRQRNSKSVQKIGVNGLVKAFVNFTLSKVKAEGTATNTGDYSVATNTGDCSVATVSGKNSVAIATGDKGKVKGALECYIALAEWKNGELVNFEAHKVDGKIIKPDTFYVLKNGKFVEAKNDEN